MELALAGVAAVLSLASLTWQALTWKWSAARPVVESDIIESVKFPGGVPEYQGADLRVTLRNVGRAQMQATSVQMDALMGDFAFSPDQYQIGGPRLPVVVAPGCSEVILFDASAIAAALAHHEDIPCEMKVVVALGHGKQINPPRTVTFTDEMASGCSKAIAHARFGRRVAGRDGGK